jgi:hypothetical protein
MTAITSIPNPVVLTFNGSSKSLPKINQDNYGSEYYLAEASDTWRLTIRHSQESVQKDGSQFDRHNVSLTHVHLPSSPTAADGYTEQEYAIIRNLPASTATEVGYLNACFAGFLAVDGLASLLFGWQN